MGVLHKIAENRIQLFRFGMAGAICAVLEIFLFRFFAQPEILPSLFAIENAHYDYPISNFLSTGTAIVLNYYLSIRWVFEPGKHNQRREFAYFVLLSLLTLIVSWRIFAIFSNYIITQDLSFMNVPINHLVLNKIIAIGLTSIFNYLLKKKVIFLS